MTPKEMHQMERKLIIATFHARIAEIKAAPLSPDVHLEQIAREDMNAALQTAAISAYARLTAICADL